MSQKFGFSSITLLTHSRFHGIEGGDQAHTLELVRVSEGEDPLRLHFQSTRGCIWLLLLYLIVGLVPKCWWSRDLELL